MRYILIKLYKLLKNKFHYCNRCYKYKATAIHHIDKNKENNIRKNLIFLCRNCHQTIHHPNRKYSIDKRHHRKTFFEKRLYRKICFEKRLMKNEMSRM